MQITSDLFTFPFRDERWKSKAAIGVLIGLFGILLFPLLWVLSGYGVRVMRHSIHHDEPRLPEWDDWGGLFMDGLRHFFIILVYTLPFSLILCGFISTILILTAGAPLLFLSSDEAVAGMSMVGMWFGFMVGGIAITIVTFLVIPLSFLATVALTRAIAHNRLGAAFEFGEVLKLTKAGFGNFLLALVMWYVVIFALSFASNLLLYTVVFCIVYPIVYGLILMYSAVIQGALMGIAYRATMRQMEGAPELPAAKPAEKDRAASLPPSVAPAPAPEAAFNMDATPMSAATPIPPAPAPEPAPAEAAPPPAAAIDPHLRDDLTVIAGIGPTFAQRLYAAGIVTFALLAEQSVERLREVTQARATANPQAWIDEARRRMSG